MIRQTKYYSDSGCTSQIGTLVSLEEVTTLTIPTPGDFALAITASEYALTPANIAAASDWNSRSVCGLTGWIAGEPQILSVPFTCMVAPGVGTSANNPNSTLPMTPDFSSTPNTLVSGPVTLIRQ